jgi:hypothetical protein
VTVEGRTETVVITITGADSDRTYAFTNSTPSNGTANIREDGTTATLTFIAAAGSSGTTDTIVVTATTDDEVIPSQTGDVEIEITVQ